MKNTEKGRTHIVIFGATGFVGRALVARMLGSAHPIVVATRNAADITVQSQGVEYRLVDFNNIATLTAAIPLGSIVINLIFSGENLAQNLLIAKNLADASKNCEVKKFLHISTAVIVGRSRDLIVTEATEPMPRTNYEKSKHEVDKFLWHYFDRTQVQLIILKPTAIFGPGGKNLWKLYTEIRNANSFIAYLKACINKNRNFHLVRVDKVVNAIIFIAESNICGSHNEFLISDDDVKINTFGCIDDFIRDWAGAKWGLINTLGVPELLTRSVLYLRGVSDVYSQRVYCDRRLRDLGFNDCSRSFEATLEDTLLDFDSRYRREIG